LLRVVGVVGYHNSGKTTLTRALAGELIGRGHQVAVVKHTSHPLDVPGTDTDVLREAVSQVGFISPEGAGVFWDRALSLEDLLPHLEADIVLVEGFKGKKTYPKIVCLRGEPDDRDLFDGLAIAAVGPASQVTRTTGVRGLNVPILDRDEVEKIADLVEMNAFKLPALDCGGCGHERCYDMAREIVAGTGSIEDCVSLQPSTGVRIDGEPLPLNPFIAGIVRGTVLGLLSPLKGFKKGKIEISI
jgi:molybdopterin-guanine dinucleotide biosynthesis protein B